MLVLDELGAVKSSEWVWDTVSYILNSRYNEQRTTIITTNFPDGPSGKAEKKSLALRNPAKKTKPALHHAKKRWATASLTVCVPACMTCAVFAP